MIDAPTWVEWLLLIATMLVVCFVAFALTARRIGGWRQLQMQLTSPELPMRYLAFIIPATVGVTVLIDPLDSVSGTSWIWEVLFPLGLYAGLVWSFTRRSRHLESASVGEGDSLPPERVGQRKLAWTAIAASLVLAVIGIVVLREGNLAGAAAVFGVVVANLSLLGLGYWFSRNEGVDRNRAVMALISIMAGAF